MEKFYVTLSTEYYKAIVGEAGKRGISIQALLRVVIIPDWAVVNLRLFASPNKSASALQPGGEKPNTVLLATAKRWF
jgi:hypothetical protein